MVIIILCTCVIRSFSQDKVDLLIRSEKILAAGDTSRALAAFSETLRIFPQSYTAALRLAEINYALRNDVLAIQYCNVALDITDDFIESTARSEKLLGLESRTNPKIRKHTTDQAYIHTLKADIRIKQNREADAEYELQRAIRLDSFAMRPVLMLSEIMALNGRTNQAIDLLKKAIEKIPENSHLPASLANLYVNIGERDLAILTLQKIIANDKSYKWAYLTLGNLMAGDEKFEEALKNYSQYLEMDSASSEVLYRRAYIYSRLHQWELAIEDWDHAIKLNPENVELYRNRGLTHFQNGDYQKALYDFDKALELLPDQTYTHINRGYAKLLLDRKKEALKDINQGLKIAPKYALGFYIKALCLKEMNKNKKACQALDQALIVGYPEKEIDKKLFQKCF